MPVARFTMAELKRYHATMKELGISGVPAVTLTDDGPRFEMVDSATSAQDDGGSTKKGINVNDL